MRLAKFRKWMLSWMRPHKAAARPHWEKHGALTLSSLPPPLCLVWQRHPGYPGWHTVEPLVWTTWRSHCWSRASTSGWAYREHCLWPTTPPRP